MAALDRRDIPDGDAVDPQPRRPADVVDDLVARREQFAAPLAAWLRKPDAEDALQDAYLKLLMKGRQLRRASSAEAWFRRLLCSAAIDRARRMQAERRAVASAWLIGAAPAASSDSASPCGCVHDALAQIQPGYAHVRRRVDMEGGNVGIVAAEFGITRNNLRVRLYRARRALRARLSAVCGVHAQRAAVPTAPVAVMEGRIDMANGSSRVRVVGRRGMSPRAVVCGFAVAVLAGCASMQSNEPAPEQQVFITPSDRVLVLPLRDGSCLPVYGNHVMCHLTGEHLDAGDVPKGAGTEIAALLFTQLQTLGVSVIAFERGRELFAAADSTAVDRYEPSLAADLGRQAGATKVLMGVVSRYEDRSGTRLGNGLSAAVALSLALVDVATGTVTDSARFNREQSQVTTNLLALPTWWQGGVQWQTRTEVANEAVAEAARALVGMSAQSVWTARPVHPVTPELERQRRPAFMSEW